MGGGLQRYKFKVQVLEMGSTTSCGAPARVKTATKKVRMQRAASASNSSSVSSSPLSPITVMPRSRTMTIATVFVSRLAVEDLRYDIHTYGTFLRYLPQRIGKNEALDSAVDAFTTGFSTLHGGVGGLEAFQKYGRALKAVRDSLNDPATGQTPETMCAIYLIMVVQVRVPYGGAVLCICLRLTFRRAGSGPRTNRGKMRQAMQKDWRIC